MMLRRPFPGNPTGGAEAPSPEVMAVEKERRKMIEAMARERLAGKMRDKRKRRPKAGINRPERGGYGERRPGGPPVWEGFPKKGVPTRLPRYDRMKDM